MGCRDLGTEATDEQGHEGKRGDINHESSAYR